VPGADHQSAARGGFDRFNASLSGRLGRAGICWALPCVCHRGNRTGRASAAATGTGGTGIEAAEDTGMPPVPAHSGLVRLGREMKGRMEMTRVRRHRLVVAGVSLAGIGLAAGLWLTVPASASSSAHAGTPSSRGSGRAQTVSGTAAPVSGPQWVPAGSGPPPTPPPGLGGPPHWAPAGSGPPPAGGSSGMASGS